MLLVMESADLAQQLVDLPLVLLVLEVEVVEYLLLLRLDDVGVGVFALESGLPCLDFCLLLLDELDEALVLVDQVGVLGQEHFDLLLEFIHAFEFPGEEHDFLVECVDFTFQ